MLMLHAGAEPIDYDGLRSLEVPEPTATHHPIAHHRVVDVVKHMLSFYGHTVTEEHHGVTVDGARYFGLLTLKSEYGDYTDTVGLRNSHDKKFPVGIAYGAKVFVCDNLSFSGDHVVKRKHTLKLRHELTTLVSEIIEPLALEREAQHRTFELYRDTPVADARADQAVVQMYRQGIINVQRIPEVLNQWDEPTHDWGDKTAWRLFNATTFALTGRVAENPAATRQLHAIIDGVCMAA